MKTEAMRGWIGVDLDGTLAYYDRWRGIEHIGAPIPAMLRRVKDWLASGREVRIFTARAASGETAMVFIRQWCVEHIGRELIITCVKDFEMVELWDDRCVQVIPNTGRPISEPQPNKVIRRRVVLQKPMRRE